VTKGSGTNGVTSQVVFDKAKKVLRYVDANDQLEGIVALQYSPYAGGEGDVIWVTNKAGYERLRSYIDYVANALLQFLVYHIVVNKKEKALAIISQLCIKADDLDKVMDKKLEQQHQKWKINPIKLTAELVYEVFNKKNTGMRIYRSDMRFHELNKEMNKLFDTLDELTVAPSSAFAHRKLQALIRRESRFAAFKRCYIRENAAEYVKYL